MDSHFRSPDLDIEDDKEQLSDFLTSHERNSLPWFQITWITILCISNVVLIFPSLSGAFSHRLESDRMESGPYIATNFSRNQNLASLDYQNDILWDEIAPLPGFALFKTQSTKNEWELGGYSM